MRPGDVFDDAFAALGSGTGRAGCRAAIPLSSSQASEARPGRRRRPQPSGQMPGSTPLAGSGRFMSHTRPGRQQRTRHPAPGRARKNSQAVQPNVLTQGSGSPRTKW